MRRFYIDQYIENYLRNKFNTHHWPQQKNEDAHLKQILLEKFKGFCSMNS